jgi:hypothetical protein
MAKRSNRGRPRKPVGATGTHTYRRKNVVRPLPPSLVPLVDEMRDVAQRVLASLKEHPTGRVAFARMLEHHPKKMKNQSLQHLSSLQIEKLLYAIERKGIPLPKNARARKKPARIISQKTRREIKAKYEKEKGMYGIISALAREFKLNWYTIKKIVTE